MQVQYHAFTDGENISSEDIKFHAYRVEDSTASKEYYQEMDDEEKIYVYIDEATGYIESNCSGLLQSWHFIKEFHNMIMITIQINL